MTHEIDESDFDSHAEPHSYIEVSLAVAEVVDDPGLIPHRRVTFEDGFQWGPPRLVDINLFRPGQLCVLAFAGPTHPRDIVGIRFADAPSASGWLWRLPQSAILTRMHRRSIPDYERDGLTRDDLLRVEEALPTWLRNRIHFFRASDPSFQYEHWRKELDVCTLAQDFLRHFKDFAHIPDYPDRLSSTEVARAFELICLQEGFQARSQFANYWFPTHDAVYTAWHLASSRFHDPDFDAAGTQHPLFKGRYYR